MKKTSSRSGLRQEITGGYNVARKDIFDLIKEYKLSAAELGYYMLFFTVADWDKSEDRYGYIRHELQALTNILDIPYTTLRDNLNRLVNKQVIDNNDSRFRIVKPDWFNHSLMSEKFKLRFNDEFLKNYFGNPNDKCEKPQSLDLEQQKPIRDSIKGDIKDNYQNKIVLIRQELRTNEEYKKLFKENPNFPSPEDMRWIDENAELKILITNKEQEINVTNQYFDGNMERYNKCLISGGVYDTM